MKVDDMSRQLTAPVATNTTLLQRLLQLSDMSTISRFNDTNDLDGGYLRSTKRSIVSDFLNARSD
jgi:hypothetical protein